MSSRLDPMRPWMFTLAMLVASSLWLVPANADPSSGETAEAGDSFVIGTGLVVGLAGTGDSEIDEGLVERSIVGVLRHVGLESWRDEMVPGRVAKVVVTAELQDSARDGAPLTVRLIAVGDATSLAGGTLLPTPLRYTTGKVYAIGQGPVAAEGQLATATGSQENPQADGRGMTLVSGMIVLGSTELAAN